MSLIDMSIDIAFWCGQQVASGALQNVTNPYIGNLLGKMGIGGDDGEIQALGAQLSQIQETLHQIQVQVQEIIDELKVIAQEQLYQDWSNKDSQLQGTISDIDGQNQTYVGYIQDPKTSPDLLNKFSHHAISNMPDYLQQINTFLLTSPEGDMGALDLFAKWVLPLVESGQTHYLKAVSTYLNYYVKYARAQQKAVTLLVEAYNYTDKTSGNAETQWLNYQKLLLSQEDQFINNVVQLVAAGITGGFKTSIDRHPPTDSDYFLYSFELNQAVLDAFSDTSVYYQPSSTYAQAEAFLAALYVTATDARRIVVHQACNPWLYPSWINIPDTSNAPITIESATDNAQKYSANSDTSFSANYTVCNNIHTGDWKSYPYNVRRLVFDLTGMGDGGYQLTDLNNNTNYPAISESYQIPYTGLTRFQGDQCLSYQVFINSVAKAGFMNFTAYESIAFGIEASDG